MSPTLNLTAKEARQLDHLVENELLGLAEADYDGDEEYIAELEYLREKLQNAQ